MAFSRFKLELEIGSRTDVGKERSNNEDYIHVSKKLFIVADGMGGHHGGETASATAARVIEQKHKSPKKFKIFRKAAQKKIDPLESLEDSVIEAHEKIKEMNLKRREEDITEDSTGDMGTTVLAAMVKDSDVKKADPHPQKTLYIAHVGDSRAYLIRDGEITQLTEDHDQRTQMLKTAKTEPDRAYVLEVTKNSNLLIQAVGIPDQPRIKVDKRKEKLKNRDYCLLCSDGLTKMVEDQDILGAVSESKSPQDACDRLVDLANENGGKDNISVILMKAKKRLSKSWLASVAASTIIGIAGLLFGANYLSDGYLSKKFDEYMHPKAAQTVQMDTAEQDMASAGIDSGIAKPSKHTIDSGVTKAEPSEPILAAAELTEKPKPEPSVSPDEEAKKWEEKCRLAAYEKIVDLAKSTPSKSLNPKYNLKNGFSNQNLINVAFYRGTRADNNPSNDYRGGYGKPGQHKLADNFIRPRIGKGIKDIVQEGRGSKFTLASINPEGVNPSVVQECAPPPSNAVEQGSTGSLNLPNREPDEGYHDYTSKQKTVIAHLYKEFAFGKSMTEEDMTRKAAEHSISGLTLGIARDVYLDMAAEREVETEPIELANNDIVERLGETESYHASKNCEGELASIIIDSTYQKEVNEYYGTATKKTKPEEAKVIINPAYQAEVTRHFNGASRLEAETKEAKVIINPAYQEEIRSYLGRAAASKAELDIPIEVELRPESYTAKERKTICDIYKHMKFGKEFGPEHIPLIGESLGIKGLTAKIAEEVYVQKSIEPELNKAEQLVYDRIAA